MGIAGDFPNRPYAIAWFRIFSEDCARRVSFVAGEVDYPNRAVAWLPSHADLIRAFQKIPQPFDPGGLSRR
jgi:hypothetical protein